MSRLTKHSKKTKKTIIEENETAVENFMGGISYSLNPLETLKLIASSSIFAEPSYYRNSEESESFQTKKYKPIYNENGFDMSDYLLFNFDENLTTDKIFIESTNKALDDDFESVLKFAVELRTEYNMRLNPSVMFVLAVLHPKRQAFNEANPGLMKKYAESIIKIPSDVSNMFDFFLYTNGSKNKMPSILKRVFAKTLSGFSKYHISKYKSKSLIDIVRISHAHSEILDELMQTGKIVVEENEKTWEQLRSEKMEWVDIIKTIKIPHMALLRNLRNIFESTASNNISIKEMKQVLTDLENGVAGGKQFPFRYYTAYKIISSSDVLFKKEILVSLENCLDKAMENFPTLKGRTVSLCDNSGSAQSSFISEYGTTKISDIANLSSVMTAINSESGAVVCFGDRMTIQEIRKNKRVLEELKSLDTDVGMGTENGIWLYLDKAIKTKEHIDNLFIYSDMQSGHGGLYGIDSKEYKDFVFKGNYIDVMKLIDVYRKKVNPKLNVFSVQVAGYNNSIIPENIYRGAILYGWTGKEVLFAQKIIDFWDTKENSNN